LNWNDIPVVVTGGASFIGSHLVEALVKQGANVTVCDDFSSGRYENLKECRKQIKIYEVDVREYQLAKKAIRKGSVIFHLAASHGGRAYIDTHPFECWSNIALDQLVFRAAVERDCKKIVYAGSACVYPVKLQAKGTRVWLKEDDADFYNRRRESDGEYGWAKLIGEAAIKSLVNQRGLKAAVARIFSAYGPRENETHAVLAWIARAFVKQNPYEIWGDGKQERNFTYVKDIVDGMLRLAERVDDGTPVNLGQDKGITVDDGVRIVCKMMDHHPTFHYDRSKPVGVYARMADLARAKRVLNWTPRTSYESGLTPTIDWYMHNRNREFVLQNLDKILFERDVVPDKARLGLVSRT
jgi:nucleoside-diphosphate-sugar epimerase